MKTGVEVVVRSWWRRVRREESGRFREERIRESSIFKTGCIIKPYCLAGDCMMTYESGVIPLAPFLFTFDFFLCD